jgi:hypothetical protein
MIIDAGRLARSARLLRWVSLAGILIVAAGMLLGMWALLTDVQSDGPLTLRVDSDGLRPVPACAVLVIAGSLLILALVEIARMLRAVERGAPFAAGARLRRFAFYLFLSLLAATLLPPLIQWGETMVTGAPGRVSMDISSEDLLMLFVTGLLFFVARLLEAAQHIAEDHQQIV